MICIRTTIILNPLSTIDHRFTCHFFIVNPFYIDFLYPPMPLLTDFRHLFSSVSAVIGPFSTISRCHIDWLFVLLCSLIFRSFFVSWALQYAALPAAVSLFSLLNIKYTYMTNTFIWADYSSSLSRSIALANCNRFICFARH